MCLLSGMSLEMVRESLELRLDECKKRESSAIERQFSREIINYWGVKALRLEQALEEIKDIMMD